MCVHVLIKFNTMNIVIMWMDYLCIIKTDEVAIYNIART